MLVAAIVAPTVVGCALYATARFVWFATPGLLFPIFVLVSDLCLLMLVRADFFLFVL